MRIPAERRLGAEGDGFRIALASLDTGRLGTAAVATGLAQGAFDAALAYAQQRETFGRRIIDHQGLAFVLADMEVAGTWITKAAHGWTTPYGWRRDDDHTQ